MSFNHPFKSRIFGGRNIKYPINLPKLKPQKNRSLLTIILERSECFNLSSELIFCPQNQYYFCNARRGCVIIPNKFQTSETCKRAQSWNPNYVNNNHLTPTSVKHEQPQKLRGFFSLLSSVYALVYPRLPSDEHLSSLFHYSRLKSNN